MITGKTRLTGLLGWPVSHSKSPQLHSYWLKQAGIDGTFLPLPVAPEDIPTVMPALSRMGFIGLNVTVPHKQAVMKLVDHLDPLAERIGAVNCLTLQQDGSWLGSNTDAAGFLLNLQEAHPGFSAGAGPIVLLGAGGAAHAAAAALIDAGAKEIRLLNRSLDKAEELAGALGSVLKPMAWEWRHEALGGAQLLVNSTSLGMDGKPPLELDLRDLPKTALVNDLVYAPLETRLLAEAKQRGNAVADGLGMLMHQARPAFANWWGITPEITPEIRQLMLAP